MSVFRPSLRKDRVNPAQHVGRDIIVVYHHSAANSDRRHKFNCAHIVGRTSDLVGNYPEYGAMGLNTPVRSLRRFFLSKKFVVKTCAKKKVLPRAPSAASLEAVSQ